MGSLFAFFLRRKIKLSISLMKGGTKWFTSSVLHHSGALKKSARNFLRPMFLLLGYSYLVGLPRAVSQFTVD